MPFKTGNIAFTGSDGVICCYYSQGRFIYRSASSLTGERVKKDPAFEGFRKSCNRMKEASPIAAALYKQIPAAQKQYSIYRLLTGEALKLIKQGIDKKVIAEKLHQLYIDPILQKTAAKTKSDHQTSLKGRLFVTNRPAERRLRSRKKQRILQTVGTVSERSTHISVTTYILSKGTDVSLSQQADQPTTSGPIYLGRLKGYRRLKMWLLPNFGSPQASKCH